MTAHVEKLWEIKYGHDSTQWIKIVLERDRMQGFPELCICKVHKGYDSSSTISIIQYNELKEKRENKHHPLYTINNILYIDMTPLNLKARDVTKIYVQRSKGKILRGTSSWGGPSAMYCEFCPCILFGKCEMEVYQCPLDIIRLQAYWQWFIIETVAVDLSMFISCLVLD